MFLLLKQKKGIDCRNLKPQKKVKTRPFLATGNNKEFEKALRPFLGK